jgi:hypothetical protein
MHSYWFQLVFKQTTLAVDSNSVNCIVAENSLKIDCIRIFSGALKRGRQWSLAASGDQLRAQGMALMKKIAADCRNA